jgi:hypothetical protein
MSYNQNDLGRRFHDGATSGQASNVRIEDFPDLDLTAVIGYGHAVYATRDKTTGHTVYYEGWYSRSQSTKQQISKMSLSFKADEVVDERKSRGTLRRADKKARRDGVAA